MKQTECVYLTAMKNLACPCWFDPGKEPEDSWEKSTEGKQALEWRKQEEKQQADCER